MQVSIQYLEGGSPAAMISPEEARGCLRTAFEDLPLVTVLLGWDLPPRVVEACAEECALHGADLYLWQPLLTAHGPFQPDPDWSVVGLDGHPVAGFEKKPEFTFVCPNRPGVRESVLRHLSAAVASGYYRGVFLDRIRFPSPSGDPASLARLLLRGVSRGIRAGRFRCFPGAAGPSASYRHAGRKTSRRTPDAVGVRCSRTSRASSVAGPSAAIPPAEHQRHGQGGC